MAIPSFPEGQPTSAPELAELLRAIAASLEQSMPLEHAWAILNLAVAKHCGDERIEAARELAREYLAHREWQKKKAAQRESAAEARRKKRAGG